MYYIIDKIPVFLSHNKYNEVFNIALEGKDALYKVASTMHGTKESTEKRKLIYEHLLSLYNSDRNNFHRNWIEFELLDEEAADNTWDILNDYCMYYGYSYLSDIRSFQQQFIGDYAGDIRYPMGRVFLLNHTVKPYRWWWKYTHNMSNRNIFIVIDTTRIEKIVGNLKHFEIYTDNFILDCGEEFGINPI